ncbi:Gfo/Idh/MocA family protein [Fodinibius sediminis]|uniref:Predicted dehydrogenase n=1 Tax=Fodinibius sediminis TaxID=1214077 RepID=A0A521BZP0_9BACT|nr:Gfo/Idh/MocA family oxidoreductase [Fodinibius sediminis]SMO52686.1 Predicted dehydrogenase [Fodinibius sediminis]
MNNSRRSFLKKIGLAGLSIPGLGFFGGGDAAQDEEPYQLTRPQRFNMHGYAAPKLDTVKVGIIGLGNRGSGTVLRLASIEGVEIRALCDLIPERVESARKSLEGTSHDPDGYSGSETEWEKVCRRDDLDLISVVTPWKWHTPMAVCAMENGKHVYTELPAAQTIEDAWKLVDTSERTRRHCFQISGSCHRSMQAVMLNMARKGFFGDLVHGEGAYIHHLLENYMFNKGKYQGDWRLKENLNRSGNLYPQHGLGPIAQMMDLNYGDQMDYLVSMSSNDFMMQDWAREAAQTDDYYEQFTDWNYRGNMNTTIIKTKKGRTIMLQHDVSSMRPYSNIHLISGTKGAMRRHPSPVRIATGHDDWLSREETEALVEEYTPEMIKRFNRMLSQSEAGNYDHSYYNVDVRDWRYIDCLRNGLPIEMDVYDAALWTSIIPLSEWSVANGSKPVKVPDFTGGAWKSNKRGMDIELENGGGNTRLI